MKEQTVDEKLIDIIDRYDNWEFDSRIEAISEIKAAVIQMLPYELPVIDAPYPINTVSQITVFSLCVRAGLEALSCQPAPMPN